MDDQGRKSSRLQELSLFFVICFLVFHESAGKFQNLTNIKNFSNNDDDDDDDNKRLAAGVCRP